MITSERRFLPVCLMHPMTENSESFHSYLSRIAFNHGLSIKATVDHAARWSGFTHDFKDSEAIKKVSVVPDGKCTDLIEIISPSCFASKEELEASACTHLYPAIRRSPGSFTYKLRWCAGCIRDQRSRNEPAHTKATWNFSEISACHIHEIYFSSCCARCGFRPSRIIELEDECWCTQFWGSITDIGKICRDPGAYGHDLLNLYKDLVTRSEPYPMDSVQRFGRAFLDETLRRNYVLGSRVSKKDAKYALWTDLSELRPPGLKQLRRFASLLGVPIENILSNEHAHTAPMFDDMANLHRDELLHVLKTCWTTLRTR